MARVRFHGQEVQAGSRRLSEALQLEAKRFRLPLASARCKRAFSRVGRCNWTILQVLETADVDELDDQTRCGGGLVPPSIFCPEHAFEADQGGEAERRHRLVHQPLDSHQQHHKTQS